MCEGQKGRVNPSGGYREFSGAYPRWEECWACKDENGNPTGTVPIFTETPLSTLNGVC